MGRISSGISCSRIPRGSEKRPINFDSDAKAADAPENLIINANNPDISKFIARGGKLFVIGGWADTGIAPFSNTEYYEAMLAKWARRR